MFGIFGLGKKRSKVGKLLDKYGYSQEERSEGSGVSRNTVSKLCNDPEYVPSARIMKRIIKFIRREIDPNATVDDFFDI